MTIGIVKLTIKIPPWHNSIIPIKIKGHSITGQTACFISNQESTKGKDPNINILNQIHNIKGKTSVNILVLNYSNKHVTFNKGEYLRHLENIDEEENSHPQTTNKQKWCQNKWNQMLLNHHATSSNQTSGPSLKHSWRNMNHNAQEMKLPSVQHL